VYDALLRNAKLMEGPYRAAAVALRKSFREIEDDELFHWSIAERMWANMSGLRRPCGTFWTAPRAATEARVRRVELAEMRAI
jgi:hypothetical protein